MAAKKKDLNESALQICTALKTAMSLDKDAKCITHNGHLIATTNVGTIYVPCDMVVNQAFLAREMFDALHECDKPYSHTEDAGVIRIAWGRRRATLKAMAKVTVFAPPLDAIANPNIHPEFATNLRDAIKDLKTSAQDVITQVVYFDSGSVFWTDRHIAAQIYTYTYMPTDVPVLVFVKDLVAVLAGGENVVGIGGTASTLTFHFETGAAIQIPRVDTSTVKYPIEQLRRMFGGELFDTTYPLTDEFLEGIKYVTKFTDKPEQPIHVSPTHIGTDENPDLGTAVDQTDVPLLLRFLSGAAKQGAFTKGKELVKVANPASQISFFIKRPTCIFAFVRVR